MTPSFFAVPRSHSIHQSRTASLTTCRSVTMLRHSSLRAFEAQTHPARSALQSVRIGARFSMYPLAVSSITSAFTGSVTATSKTLGAFSSRDLSAASAFSSGVAPIRPRAAHSRNLSLASSPIHPKRSPTSNGSLSRVFMTAKAETPELRSQVPALLTAALWSVNPKQCR